MALPREILFVDPAVADLDTILGSLRPEVEPVVLDPARPAARQIATALEERRGHGSVHVIAHGAPGRVCFAAGDWSAETLAGEAEDLAAIGRALGADDELRLWSCATGAGAAGRDFVERLAQATGADVAAATGRVGAAARGGDWQLTVRSSRAAAMPPLTPSGIAAYAGVLATQTWIGAGGSASDPTGGDWSVAANWLDGAAPVAGDDAVLGGSAGGNPYTVTLDVSTPALNSLTINAASGATLAVGANTLNVNGTGSGATDTINVAANNSVTMAGGALDAGNVSLAGSLTGFGTLNVAGGVAGSGTIQASGGTLDVTGTIASGVTLQVGTASGSDLKIESSATAAAPITLDNSNQTLEVGAAGSLTLNGAENVTAGMIQLDGGTLSDASGVTIGTGATLVGSGIVAAPLSGSGAVVASGGTLDITDNVASGVSGLQIAPGATPSSSTGPSPPVIPLRLPARAAP